MNDDIERWLAELSKGLETLRAADRRRGLRTVTPLPAHRIRSGDRVYMNLASNDYLGLGCDVALHRAFARSLAAEDPLERIAFTASASRLLGGEHPAFETLERLLGEVYGHGRRALLFGSGYHANIGILPALVGREDLILSDRLVHASLVDGIRLCRAQSVRYRHNDMAHLSDLLAAKAHRARRVFIVTESLFSMDGDLVELRALVDLKRQYGAVLYLDEAHAVGVRGPRGLGLAAEQGLIDDVDILLGTFGKALASAGAYAIVAPPVREHLVNTARSLIFTTALPPVMIRWAIFALRNALEADERRARLGECARVFRQALGGDGVGTHIVPVVVGEDVVAGKLSLRLRERGYWVPPIRPPTVPEGTARLRFSLGADMNLEALGELATETLRLRKEL
ncbi:MAG: aminotransferase class I/II-fold pyridoxal phosphate-dependent enzyme [Planctomycetota bacterium]